MIPSDWIGLISVFGSRGETRVNCPVSQSGLLMILDDRVLGVIAPLEKLVETRRHRRVDSRLRRYAIRAGATTISTLTTLTHLIKRTLGTLGCARYDTCQVSRSLELRIAR